MTKPRAGLRQISTLAIAALTAMTVVVVATLIALTTRLHVASDLLGDSLAGVQLAEEARIDLLFHARDGDPLIRADAEANLGKRLVEAQRYVTAQPEQAELDAARAAVADYLAGSRDRATPAAETTRLLQTAYGHLRQLASINVEQAAAARRDVEHWDLLGDIIGLGAGVLMVAVLGGLLWWIRSAVVRRIFGLADAMQRFGKGELAARADEQGPAELREMARRFNTLAETLARQQQQRLTYLAGIAHDLRNPLGALQLSTDVIEPDRPLPPEAQLRRTLGLIRRQVAQLDRMVSDLLETAQIEAGQLSLRPVPTDLQQIVKQVVDLFGGASPRHQLRVELPDEPLVVRCDPLRIEQTFTNLVSNAIKYSPSGGEVRITATAAGGAHAVVSVADQGIGMTEEDREQIWEPFRRARRSAENIPGVGLGLSIAKHIVEAHGGQIEVRSEPGAGSTFTVKLPLDRSAAGPDAGAGAAAGAEDGQIG